MLIIVNVDGQVMHPMTRSLDPNKEGENKATENVHIAKKKPDAKMWNKNRTENKYLLSHYTNDYNVGQTNIQPRKLPLLINRKENDHLHCEFKKYKV